MTLEEQIAECNTYPDPLKTFIESYDNYADDDAGVLVTEACTLFDSFHNTSTFLSYVAQNLKLDWMERETMRPMHPIILRLLDSAGVDCDWYAILLEWPHVSQDGDRLAYTRSAAAGVQDRQTLTSLGKYLARHFSYLPANVLRDAAALFTPDKFEIWDTIEGIVRGVQDGPPSCMKWLDHTDIDTHPYSCYTPQNGWTLAVRISEGVIAGRCLCHTKNDTTIFVRSFKQCVANGYSHSDVALESWLKAKGYTHEHEWRSYCQIDTRGGELFPYIDGACQRVDENGFITPYGQYLCTDTGGDAANADGEDEDSEYCHECERRRESGTWTGRHEDTWVCDSCMDDYTFVTGCRGNDYYVADDRAVEIGGNYYDVEYLSDNDIVELADGDHAKLDDCVCIDSGWCLTDSDSLVYYDNEYHLLSDEGVIELHEERPGTDDRHAHIEDTWTCADTGYIYHNDTPYIEIDDEIYHLDSATAQAFAESEAQQLTLELEPS